MIGNIYIRHTVLKIIKKYFQKPSLNIYICYPNPKNPTLLTSSYLDLTFNNYIERIIYDLINLINWDERSVACPCRGDGLLELLENQNLG